MLVFAAPGQGSQSQGFLAPWIEASPGLAKRLAALSETCDRDLIQLGTVADEDTIRQTDNAQRLIVGSAIAIYREFFQGKAQAAVGHSVGEFAAAAIAGIISDEDAMRLVSVRADAMAKAAALQATTMAAILGGEPSEVEAKISASGLYSANFNGAGQLVAAGSKENMANFVANPPEKARVIELRVAGAFHTPYMAPAVEELAVAAAGVVASDPQIPIWTNFDGSRVVSGSAFLDHMVAQTARPVRWDLCMQQLSNEAAKVVELPPAGALAGLIKRGAPGASALALKNLEDIAKVDSL